MFLGSMPGADMFISILSQVSAKLQSKLGSFLRIEAKILKRSCCNGCRWFHPLPEGWYED